MWRFLQVMNYLISQHTRKFGIQAELANDEMFTELSRVWETNGDRLIKSLLYSTTNGQNDKVISNHESKAKHPLFSQCYVAVLFSSVFHLVLLSPYCHHLIRSKLSYFHSVSAVHLPPFSWRSSWRKSWMVLKVWIWCPCKSATSKASWMSGCLLSF